MLKKSTKPKAPWTTAFPSQVKSREKKPKRIRARTNKRAAHEAKYRKRVREWLTGRRCSWHCSEPATECHHSRGRIGKLLLDERYWVPVCTFHHHLIHDFPDSARKVTVLVDDQPIPLLCARGDWNTPD